MNALPRLSPATLGLLPAHISRPVYDRTRQGTSIIHFGIGAFHRAHQAAYFDTLMNAGEANSRILGVSMRSEAVPKLLNPQEGLFTLVSRDGNRHNSRVIGAIGPVLLAGRQSDAIIRGLVSPATNLATITVTEKGYCLDPATRRLDLDHPAIAEDLKNPNSPASLPGLLVAGLSARRAAGHGPLTILSCDNLFHNGRATRDAVLGFAAATDSSLANWIEAECAFPSSMVDRIVPATTPEDIETLSAETGILDPAMVKTEPFHQWVIEDRFATRKPPLDHAGATFSNDVQGWEHAKLRLLNGAHSAMAYFGALAGMESVHEAIEFSALRAHVERLWDEQEATLNALAGFDPRSYRQQLVARFRNSALDHRTRQIAMDGSQKLPQRLVAPLLERRARGIPCPDQCLAIAAWMRWQTGSDEQGHPYTVDDPLAGTTREALARSDQDAGSMVRALLSIPQVFDPKLAGDAHVVSELTRSLGDLLTLGAKETLRRRM